MALLLAIILLLIIFLLLILIQQSIQTVYLDLSLKLPFPTFELNHYQDLCHQDIHDHEMFFFD